MPPKVLASLESQLPSGLVTWLWSSYFKIECYISRLITQLGIKTTLVSCPALFQWRRDACRRLEGNTKVSVGVLLPSQPRTRTHIPCFLALTFYFSHQASGSLLWGTAWKAGPTVSPCCYHMGGTGEQGTSGFTLAVEALSRSSSKTEVSSYSHSPTPMSSPCWWLTAESLHPMTGSVGGWRPNPLATAGPTLKGRPSPCWAGQVLCCDRGTVQPSLLPSSASLMPTQVWFPLSNKPLAHKLILESASPETWSILMARAVCISTVIVPCLYFIN